MKFTQVSYQKTFNLGSYQSERIGVEIELSEGESPKEALDTAKQLVEEYHKENIKVAEPTTGEIYLENEIKVNIGEVLYDFPKDKTPPPPPKQNPTISEQIASCTDIKILESYKLIVKKNPDLQEVYNQTMDKLTNKN